MRFVGKAREGIEQHAVGVGIDQGAVVMLAMNFDEKLARLAHQLNAERLVVDEGLGAAIGRLHAAEDQVAIVIDAIFAQKLAGSVLHADIEDCRHLAVILAMTHEIAIAAPAKGQRETVKQDGFARARLAGQYRKPGFEGKIQPLDQDDIADRKLEQHRALNLTSQEEVSCPLSKSRSLRFHVARHRRSSEA